MTLDLIVIGFGNVGRRLVRLLDEIGPRLTRDEDVRTRVVAIATRSRGCVQDPSGIDGPALATHVEHGGMLGPRVAVRELLRDALRRNAASAREGRLVVVEVTTLDARRGQPASTYVRDALASGAHVVTANKGPAAFAHATLERAARRAGRRFLFESAVLDGIPLFNMARAALPGVAVTGFRGVVNSTTNYILTAMEEGRDFATALTAMQERGIAEADPSHDVDGWDAAAKTAVVANALIGGRLTPHTVEREGISPAAATGIRAARGTGGRLKLVASAERKGRSVRGQVRLTEVPANDLLAGIDGQQNAIVLHTDLLGEFAIVQRGSGLTMTAYGLVSDLVTVARGLRSTRANRRRPTRARRDRSPSRRGRR